MIEFMVLVPRRLLLIGKGSFLGRAVWAGLESNFQVDAIAHSQFEKINLSDYPVVVNFAFDRTVLVAQDEEHDFDLRVAREVAKSTSHFVMLSSRRVYGESAPFPAHESDPIAPTDPYGINKARTEAAVQALLGERATILRLANVFGFEPGRHTFFGIALGTLREKGQICLDTSPFVRRDFLPLENFVEGFQRIMLRPLPGIYNMGSGQATPIGQVALHLLEGFGCGELVITSPIPKDEFLLDSSHLNCHIGNYCQAMDVSRRCIEIGRLLRNA